MSFALNGRPGVAETTRHRILEAADELDWRPSARGRALSESRARALGLVMFRPAGLLAADPFFARFIAGVETELGPRGIALVLQVVSEATEAEGYRRLALEGRADGVFLTDVRTDDSRIALLRELNLPAVAAQPGPDPEIPWVGIDDREGIAAAVAHLAALGHSRIAHVAGPPQYVHSSSRRQGFVTACDRLGLSPGPIVTGDFTAAGGAAATTTLLDRPAPPTAVIYANDLMAVGGMQAARAAGRHIPGDLSVVGFDDIPLAPHLSPALTTVSADVDALGRRCATALLNLVEGRPPDGGWLDPPRLLRRGSTAVPPNQVSVDM